ncbi:MAG: TlpA disulfide reductase family protein [Bacteroidota bacterium]
MKLHHFLPIIVLTLVVAACQTTNKTKDLPEKLVDRIDLVDLEGNVISMDSLKGKTVFLNYWATWCRPCIAEMPDMDKAAKELAEEDFVFLAASDEDIEKIRSFIEKYDYSFQFVHSKSSVFDLELSALPTTWVINKDGEIVYNEVGARKWDSEEGIKNLKELALK